jgi:hypothetical protein
VNEDLCSKVLLFAEYDSNIVLESTPSPEEDVRLNHTAPASADLRASVCIREFLDVVPANTDCEFRSFVFQNQLNAVTQYDSQCYSPRLVQNADRISQLIQDFFATHVRDELARTHESYVIDFLVIFENDVPAVVKVIEINPFHNGAGACLFSWSSDRELFMNGPFEFRYVKSPIDNVLLQMPGGSTWEEDARKMVTSANKRRSMCGLM